MKKLIFTLLSFCLLAVSSNAQYCGAGSSGPTVCIPSGTLTQPGLSPVSDSLAPIVNCDTTIVTIQFKNFDTVRVGTTVLTVNSLCIDSITNLPAGYCWKTNKVNNCWGNREDGCITVSGVTLSDPGQYRLGIYVFVNGLIHVNAAAANLKYYVRVINHGDATIPIDTSHQEPFYKAPGYSATATCATTGITSFNSSVNNLNIVPNPFNNKAVVSFLSEKSALMTERMTDLLGSEVYKKEIEIKIGDNTSVIEKGNLPTGVYFYSLSDGKSMITKRVVITE